MLGEAAGVCILTSICDVQEQDDARASQEGLEGSANCHSPLSLMRLPMACAGESAQSQVKRRRGGAATAAAGGPSPLRCRTCPPLRPGGQLANGRDIYIPFWASSTFSIGWCVVVQLHRSMRWTLIFIQIRVDRLGSLAARECVAATTREMNTII